MKLWRFPKIEGSILKYRAPALWPRYIGEVRTNFAIAYGIKVGCYWELFGKHVKNLGTLCFDPPPRKKKKACMESPLSIVQVESEQWTVHSPHQTQLENKNPDPLTHKKRREAPSLHDVTSHWLHRNCIPKIGCHYFWPRLIALLINLNFVNNFAYIGKFKLFLI